MNEATLDTNIFIRHITQDLPEQLEQTKKIFDTIERGKLIGLVSILVINETLWILQHYYNLKRSVFIPKLLKLLSIKNLKIIENKKEVIVAVLEAMQKRKFDFTDVYLAHTTPKDKLLSFDKDFDKLYKK